MTLSLGCCPAGAEESCKRQEREDPVSKSTQEQEESSREDQGILVNPMARAGHKLCVYIFEWSHIVCCWEGNQALTTERWQGTWERMCRTLCIWTEEGWTHSKVRWRWRKNKPRDGLGECSLMGSSSGVQSPPMGHISCDLKDSASGQVPANFWCSERRGEDPQGCNQGPRKEMQVLKHMEFCVPLSLLLLLFTAVCPQLIFLPNRSCCGDLSSPPVYHRCSCWPGFLLEISRLSWNPE